MNRLPYPLVGGFLARLGWVLSVASISISCGITLNWETLPELLESDMIRKWAPNLADALVLLSATKLRSHYLVLPASVVLALGLCHAVLFFLGISAEEASAAGILFVGMPAGASWPPVDVEVLTHVDRGVVASQLPGIPGLDPAAPPLVAWLGPIADEVERTAPAHVSFEPELTFLVDCNWKTYVDNYQEGYHIPPLHPGLNRDLDWKRYRVVNFAGGSLHEAPPKGRSVHPGTFGWRFPNFTFNSYPDGLSFMRMEPAGHTQTRLVYHYYRPDSVSVEDFEATVTYGTLVSEEDQWIVPLIQQNLDAGVYDRGPLSPRHESGVFHFHKTVRGPRLRTSRRQSRSIRVTWDDGIAGTFHHLWLRDNRVSNLRHEYLRLPTRDSANIAAESTTVRAEVRPRSRNPLQCCRPFLIVAGVTGWRMKH